MGKLRRIDEMYAFTQVDPTDNTEGVIAFHTGQGWMPMVGADMERVEYLRPMAQSVADETQTPVKVLRFSEREEIGVVNPRNYPSPR